LTAEIEMTCDSLLSQISSYLDGELPELTCAAIEKHAASCTECGGVIAEFRTATGLCRSAASAPLPEDVRARARERVRELLKTSSKPTNRASRT
jgi:anti-sigma factor RsiW